MKKAILIITLLATLSPLAAQRVLTLDSCRALAIDGNKQLSISRMSSEMASNARKAAKTNYLPKVDIVGGYEFFSKEISLLNNDQKTSLGSMGTNLATGVGSKATDVITALVQQGIISPQAAGQLGQLVGNLGTPLAQWGNQLGGEIADAFKTDTKHIWYGSVALRQPIYMGGAITALNRMAEITEEMAANDIDLKAQQTIHQIDQTYWTVVSLRQKQQLAISYRDLVKKLDSDVHKMIDNGVATRADGLKVDVKVN